MAEVDELAVVAGLRLEPVIRGFDENFRLVTGGAQHALDAEHFVADGVAVAERGQDLMDLDHPRLPAGPVGSLASTSSAAGEILAAAIEPPGQRIAGRRRRFFLQPLEHLEILAFDHRPVVMVAEVLPSVAAERAGQPAVLFDRSSVPMNSPRVS